jgi:hypothetical protein
MRDRLIELQEDALRMNALGRLDCGIKLAGMLGQAVNLVNDERSKGYRLEAADAD